MRLFQAPGRVNLIGDHIDYMGGTVMPMAIDRGTWLAARARPDGLVSATSVNFPEAGTIEIDLAGEQPVERGSWANYLVAMAFCAAPARREHPAWLRRAGPGRHPQRSRA